jgi:5-methylcytosine-specific restriction enzyme A
MHLAENPLCTDPFGDHGGVLVPANVVDHVTPHKGDMKLFFDPSNLASVCTRCHNRKTARLDGAFGNPIKPLKRLP